MKVLFASDIHGSASAMEQVLGRLETERAESWFLLGDILYHGARNDPPDRYNPKAVFAMLNAYPLKPLCVRGNCDAEIDQMVLNFPIMADYALLTLDAGRCAFVTHGHLFNMEAPPPLREGDALIHGHTHVHCAVPFGGNVYLNPGSAALPKENQPASYMVYEDGEFTIKALSDGSPLLRCRMGGQA